MTGNKTLSEIKKKIQLCCGKYPEIVAAYLFGSVITERFRSASDVDVGLLLNKVEARNFDLLSFVSQLENQVGRKVDVIVLNRAGELLKHEVRKYGHLIYDIDPELRKEFEIRSRRFYEDFLYLHERYVKKVIYGN